MSEGWARVRTVYQCCDFTVIFWGGTLGGTPDRIHAYVRWGCHWTSKCMGHMESKITKLKGLLRVFTPYFYWCVCHIKVQRHTCTLYTNYLFSYCQKYTVQYFLFEQTPIGPYRAYLTISNDYWSIIIWLAKHVV